MNTIERKRLLKLADFLDTVPTKKFDFSSIAYEGDRPLEKALGGTKAKLNCGTRACAIGWMPAAFPRQVAWDKSQFGIDVILKGEKNDFANTNFDVAERFFGLSEMEAAELFSPGFRGTNDKSTPKQVAKSIRKFVAEKDALTPTKAELKVLRKFDVVEMALQNIEDKSSDY